jgi:hypothetical protein
VPVLFAAITAHDVYFNSGHPAFSVLQNESFTASPPPSSPRVETSSPFHMFRQWIAVSSGKSYLPLERF